MTEIKPVTLVLVNPYKNLQEVFDKAWAGMAGQGWERATSLGVFGCEYLMTKDGKEIRCAIGHTVPKELLFTNTGGTLEVGSVTSVVDCNPKWRELFKNIDGVALQELQACHDQPLCDAEGNISVEVGMRAFAYRHELTIPELESA